MLSLNSRDLGKRSLSLSVFHFKLTFSSVAPPLEKGILGQVFFQTWRSAQKLSNPPHAVSTAGPRGSVVCLYAMCFASCNNENQGSLHKRLCCCSRCCWDNKTRREKQPKREGICFRLAVPMAVHPGKEVTMAGGRMSWSHGIPKQMLQAYAQFSFPGY